MKKLLSLTLLLFLSGCLERIQYELALTEVEKPDKQIQKMQPTTTIPIILEDDPHQGIAFADNNIQVDWYPSLNSFKFNLKNKTNETIKLIWNNAVFMEPGGFSHRVANGNTKFIKTDESVMTSSIVRGGSLFDLIYPADWAEFKEGKWTLRPLLKGATQGHNFQEIKNFYLNKDIKILLPLQIGDKAVEYLFNFKIIDIYTAGSPRGVAADNTPKEKVISSTLNPNKETDADRMEKELNK